MSLLLEQGLQVCFNFIFAIQWLPQTQAKINTHTHTHITGASVAFELTNIDPKLKIKVFEKEYMPGYHSTGRAAGLFSENYGTKAVKILSLVSRYWLENPHIDCIGMDHKPLLTPRFFFSFSFCCLFFSQFRNFRRCCYFFIFRSKKKIAKTIQKYTHLHKQKKTKQKSFLTHMFFFACVVIVITV